MATAAPGVRFSKPKPAATLAFSAQARDLPMAAGVTRRGPINRLVVMPNGWADFRKKFGGTYGDEPLPYGARWFSGMPLVVARIVGAGTKYGSLRVLDMLGSATLVLNQRNPGAWGKNVTPSVTKFTTTTAVTVTNTGGTIAAATTEVGLGSYTGAEKGDVYFATDGTNTSVGVIWNVDPANGRVQIFTKAGWCSGTVALGGTFAVSSVHLAQTVTTQALVTGATSLTLKGVRNISKGSVLLVQHLTDGLSGGTEPINLVATAVTAEGVSFAAYSGTTFPVGSFVSSIEFKLGLSDVLEDGTYAEALGPLSMSDTFDGAYIGDQLGTSLSFVAGSSLGSTHASSGAIASGATSCVLAAGIGASLVAGNWYQFGTGLQAQVKTINTDTVYFDNVGTIVSVPNGSTVKLLTMTVSDSTDNKSELVIAQEMSAVGVGDSATTPEFLRIPRPVTLGTLTGGVDGSAPTGSTAILGSATTGAKSGVRLAEDDTENLKRISWLAVPGLDFTSSSRATLDNDLIGWAEDNLIQYLTSAPTSITKPEEVKNYRLSTLGADSPDVNLYFQRVYCRSLVEGVPRVRMPVDMAQLWLAAITGATEGVPQPAANRPYPADVLDVDVTVTGGEHGDLDDVGVNCLVKKKGRVYPMGADTLYRGRTDGSKLHHSNASCSLKFILRSLEQSSALEGFPFSEGIVEMLGDLQDCANEWAKTLPKGMLERAEGAIEFICDETTTSNADLQSGDANLELHVALAGAWKRVNIKPFLHTGGVRMRRTA